jgi:chorismate mutase/large-conductance mechanosensitive channel
LEYEQITQFLEYSQEIHNLTKNVSKNVSKSAKKATEHTISFTKSIFEDIMVKYNSLTTTGQVLAASTTITLISTLLFFAVKSKNKSKNSKKEEKEGPEISKETYDKLKAEITKDLNQSFQLNNKSLNMSIGESSDSGTVGHELNTTTQRLVEIDQEISRFIAEQLSLVDEVTELKTEHEISKCGRMAQNKMQEHLHEKIEDLLSTSKRNQQMQEQTTFRQNQQDSKIDDLERTIDDFMNKSAELAAPSTYATQKLDSFKENVMTEVEDWVRSNNQHEKRKLEAELSKTKQEMFHMNETASKHEHFVAQEMRDLHEIMQANDKKLMGQMYGMEQRFFTERAGAGDNDRTIESESSEKTYIFDRPQFNQLPPSSNVSVVCSEDVPGDPVHQSTPLEKEARKAFPSKIRPPNSESTPKVMNPMVKALKKCNLARDDLKSSDEPVDEQVNEDSSFLECVESDFTESVKLPEIK